MKLKPRSPAGKRRAHRRRSDLFWRRHVPRDTRRMAIPCPRCGHPEYFACEWSCWTFGKDGRTHWRTAEMLEPEYPAGHFRGSQERAGR